MRLFDKHKVVYVTNVESEKKLVVTNIENGKPLCKTKKVEDLARVTVYCKNFLGVLVTLNGSPVVKEEHAYERTLLQVNKLLDRGVSEDKIIGFSCAYTDSDNLTPKLISKESFKTMKKQYKCKRD